MTHSPLPAKAKPVSSPKRYWPFSILAKSTLATLALVGVVGGVMYLTSSPEILFQHPRGDSVSETRKQERLSAFKALGSMPLALVPEADTPAAIDGMQLAPTAKQEFLADLARATQRSANSSTAAPESSSLPAASPVPDPRKSPENTTVAPLPGVPSAAPEVSLRKAAPLRLAWITLWDTDAQDGDVVRIDSQGYSRTIILAKEPVTVAIPVPADAIVNITGIRDGEGGGITVGLASGASRAVFPIMSAGQVLGLKVRVN